MYLGLIILFISLLALWLYQSRSQEPTKQIVNEIRLVINPIYETMKEIDLTKALEVSSVEKSLLDTPEINEDNIIVSLLDLRGEVIYTSGDKLKVGEILFIEESLYMDQSYRAQSNSIQSDSDQNNSGQNKSAYSMSFYKLSMPLYLSGKVNGFALFEVSEELLENHKSGNTIDITWVLAVFMFVVLFLILALGTVGIFHKGPSELEPLKLGLLAIAKGKIEPIEEVNQKSDYVEIYNAYNYLVEELSYVMEQQNINQNKQKRFLTMMSHELKTPIATINAYIEGLIHGVAKDPESQLNYQKIIHQKMQQLTNKIEELFKYAQEASDQFKYHFEECYSDELFESIMKALEPENTKKLSIQNNIPKCIVNVDKVRIEQVILNIYNNALKHAKEDTDIQIHGYRQDQELIIEISDNGDGIEPEDLPYIFDYYYQGKESKKTDYEGVGLGLAICREIILKHQGQIKVKSQIGKGTVFIIVLPIV